jgi:hypothetical protein
MFGSWTLCSSYILAIGIPVGLSPVRDFPALREQVAIPAYYYADSVARLIFRRFSHSRFSGFQSQGNPRLVSYPDALDLGGPFRSFAQILGMRLLGGYKHARPLHAYPGESR